VIEPDGFSVTVQNHGPTIPDSLLPRLFEPMSRGEVPGGQISSVGLGLFIVREIAHAHHGKVDVVSTQDSGTTFRASFPRSAVRQG
jgi:sigma-B regulation protein RsbU (phosphoserine phosphatase)